jgi:putative NADH-flavin reductase
MRIGIGPDVAVLAKDASGLAGAECRGFDVIIDAFSTASAQAYRPPTSRPGQGVDNVNQVAVSPSQIFAPGDATGYVLGCDERLVAPDGPSNVTTGMMAVAILGSSKSRPSHERFTVRDQ